MSFEPSPSTIDFCKRLDESLQRIPKKTEPVDDKTAGQVLRDRFREVAKEYFTGKRNNIYVYPLDQEEINTIVNYVKCSEADAIKALQKHGNLVDAVLELSPE